MLNEQMKNNPGNPRPDLRLRKYNNYDNENNQPTTLIIHSGSCISFNICARLRDKRRNSNRARLITHIIHEHQPVTRLPSINCLLRTDLKRLITHKGHTLSDSIHTPFKQFKDSV